jgi:hypothetical protein
LLVPFLDALTISVEYISPPNASSVLNDAKVSELQCEAGCTGDCLFLLISITIDVSGEECLSLHEMVFSANSHSFLQASIS